MKIMFLFVLAVASALLLSGCASVPARGGGSDQALGGLGTGTGSSSGQGQSGLVDYRQVLSDPGKF